MFLEKTQAGAVDNPSRILIIANPGHFRDSLVAILRTLEKSELFLVNPQERLEKEWFLDEGNSLVLADLAANPFSAFCLARIKKSCPDAHCIVLVDNFYQSRKAETIEVDYVLPRNASAGELLGVIRRICINAASHPVPIDPISLPVMM
jgi:hypothetical protein